MTTNTKLATGLLAAAIGAGVGYVVTKPAGDLPPLPAGISIEQGATSSVAPAPIEHGPMITVGWTYGTDLIAGFRLYHSPLALPLVWSCIASNIPATYRTWTFQTTSNGTIAIAAFNASGLESEWAYLQAP